MNALSGVDPGTLRGKRVKKRPAMTPQSTHRHSARSSLLAPIRGLAVAVLLAALAGCSTLDVPRAENYPATDQLKARAVHHWNVLADDVAMRISASALPASAQATGAYHLHTSTVSPFHRAFSSLLLTRLVNNGVPMVTQATEGDKAHARILFDVQVVQHHSSAFNAPQFPLTFLAVGLSVLRGMYLYPPTELGGAAIGLAAATGMDLAQQHMSGQAQGGPTRTELLVSTTVEQGQRLVARTSDIYYIDSEDAKLFMEPPPPPPPAPVKQWKVIGS